MMASQDCILPGATLGVFGGGQLGRMFVMAATRMGYRTIILCPEGDAPAGQIAHEHIVADYEDVQAVRSFAGQCDAITLEFENVPVSAIEEASHLAPVRPGREVLAISQDRLLERAFLSSHQLPTSPYAVVRSAQQCVAAVERLGLPVVLKSARMGYDGRGQRRITEPAQIEPAWQAIGTDAALCEAWVNYQCELSVLVARSPGGQLRTFGPIENDHAHHILDISSVPARIGADVEHRAVELARKVAHAIGLEGLLCVEMFLDSQGQLLINELAPRPHNSGHLTIEACDTSQFEQQVRAVCNLPLGDMTLRRPAAMANLLGDIWSRGEPAWGAMLGTPGAHLHLYGKSPPQPGRKMGHVTVMSDSAQQARERALLARQMLQPIVTGHVEQGDTSCNGNNAKASPDEAAQVLAKE